MATTWMIAVVTALLVMVAHVWLQWQRTRRSWQKSHGIPPGSMGLPLLGESIQYLYQPDKFVDHRQKLHGNMFSTSILGHPTVFSMDPQVNKLVLNNARLFVPRYPASLTELIGKSAMFSSRGEVHKKMRGAALSFLNPASLKDRLLPQIQSVVISNLESWGGRIVNVLDETQGMTFSTMARELIGLMPGNELETLKRDFHVLKKGLVTIPIKAPGTPYSNSFKKRQEIVNRIQNIIEDRRKLSLGPHEDLLSFLLKEKETEGSKFQFNSRRNHGFNFESVFWWAENEAIERNKKENEMLSWEDYESMRFTRDVIKETLRLYLGISTGYFRETLEDVEIGGHKIPKGWTLIVYEKSCRLDSNYYEDPLNFNPWRWQDRDVTQAPFYPFGGGIRLCPGYELAMLQVSLFIHYLITKLK
eukprot:Gb_27379 [translate_table: standard]